MLKWSGTDSYDVRAYLNADPTMQDQGGQAVPYRDKILVQDRDGYTVATLSVDATGCMYLEDGMGPFASAPPAHWESVLGEAVGLVIESGLDR